MRLPVTCFTTGVARFTTKSLLHYTYYSHFRFASRSLEFSCSLPFHFTSNCRTPADFKADFNDLPCQTPGRLLEPMPSLESPLPCIRRESGERDSWLAFSSSSHLCIAVCVCSVFLSNRYEGQGLTVCAAEGAASRFLKRETERQRDRDRDRETERARERERETER